MTKLGDFLCFVASINKFSFLHTFSYGVSSNKDIDAGVSFISVLFHSTMSIFGQLSCLETQRGACIFVVGSRRGELWFFELHFAN